jgi:glutamate/tyrosine decarboxylase-like PLP-dependent enzyme
MFAFIYRTEDDIMEFGKEAYGRFITENGLSPFAFPSLRRFETEVVAMTANMLHGGPDAVGSMTSGGSESILLAMKACRDYYREHKPEIKTPELVIPVTAHPAWNKFGHYLDVKVTTVPVDPKTFLADPAAMEAACTPNTIMMVGSAPTYPHGVVDPIGALGALCEKRDIWLHVDACVGGFVLPFAKQLGYKIPDFDFTVPGVRSISADVHKFGYAPKGASTITYRNGDYRKHQFYVYTEWPGGVYGTPNMTGARPGGAIAGAWAVMNYMGEDGYLRMAKILMETTTKIMDGLRKIPHLTILGEPCSPLFAIYSDKVNVFALADAMKKRGWHMEGQQFPPSLHITVSPLHAQIVDKLLVDFASAVDEIKDLPETDLSASAAMYGMMGSLPDRSMAKMLAMEYLDGVYKVG